MKIVFTGTFQRRSSVGLRTEVAKRLPVCEIYDFMEPKRTENSLYLCSVFVAICQGTQLLIYSTFNY